MFLCTTKHVQESFVERVSEHQDSAVYHMRIHLKSEFGSFSGSSCQPGKPLDFDECFTNLEARSHEMQNCRQSWWCFNECFTNLEARSYEMHNCSQKWWCFSECFTNLEACSRKMRNSRQCLLCFHECFTNLEARSHEMRNCRMKWFYSIDSSTFSLVFLCTTRHVQERFIEEFRNIRIQRFTIWEFT